MAVSRARRRKTTKAVLNQRLASRYHQRQAALQRAGRAMLARIGRFYGRLSQRVAAKAAETGFAGLPALDDVLDAELAEIRRAIGTELELAARRGHRTAVEAILAAVPADWLPILLGITMARTEEAMPSPEPMPWEAIYELEPIARGEVSREEAKQMIRARLFPVPAAEDIERWLTVAVPGGMSWNDRLRRWEHPTRAAMLNELTIGLSQGENIDELRQRIKPFADGLAWKAQRIARTEGNRVAERANRATIDGLGDLVQGMQIVAVMDEWTRPEHASRNGRIYTKGADGVYRASNGDTLPDLPDAPNCRCMTIPVLTPPEAFRRDPDLRAVFQSASGKLIPDPASYMDWWDRAGEQERKIAVGVKRYQMVRDKLGREPEWIDFLAPDGSLLSTSYLRQETPAERTARRAKVEGMLAQRRMVFRQVASRGWREPLRRLPYPLRGVAGGEPGSAERLKKHLLDRADALFHPSMRERQRRLKWQSTVQEAAEVRKELKRRLNDYQKRISDLKLLRREIRQSELPEPRQRELLAALVDLEEQQRRQAIEEALFLPSNERVKLSITVDAGVTSEMRGHLRDATRFVEGLTSRTIANEVTMDRVTIVNDPENTRGKYYRRPAPKITLSPEHTAPRYVHELVHHVETSFGPERWKYVHTRFAAWTKGAEPQPLGDNYSSHEQYLARTDGRRWPGDGKYAGKVKHGTMEPEEIITQSAEDLAENPWRFAQEYPELFDLVVNVLRGKRP